MSALGEQARHSQNDVSSIARHGNSFFPSALVSGVLLIHLYVIAVCHTPRREVNLKRARVDEMIVCRIRRSREVDGDANKDIPMTS